MGKDLSAVPADNWMQVFQSLLCQLYREFGGDCGSLGWSDGGQSAVAAVQAAFETNGLPPFPAAADRQEFVELLDELETHLNLPNATLSPTVKAAAESLIDDIRAALGP